MHKELWILLSLSLAATSCSPGKNSQKYVLEKPKPGAADTQKAAGGGAGGTGGTSGDMPTSGPKPGDTTTTNPAAPSPTPSTSPTGGATPSSLDPGTISSTPSSTITPDTSSSSSAAASAASAKAAADRAAADRAAADKILEDLRTGRNTGDISPSEANALRPMHDTNVSTWNDVLDMPPSDDLMIIDL